jgi:NADP-dependent 3-hydroxy acid dehydrogenase YdfG
METFRWQEQVVVVTGASEGIGARLAFEVSRRGGTPVLAARRAEKLEEVARSLPGPSFTVVAYVTHRAEVQRIAAAALERFKHVDVWVNNAGRGISRRVEELTDEDLDVMIRDNVKSALYGMQAILPHFKERRRGHLVNVSSMLGRMAVASFRSAYGASKHALNALTDNLRLDLAAEYPDVRVTTYLPGVVATNFGLRSLHGGVDSRTYPGAQPVEDVAATLATAIEARLGGDVYSFPGAADRVIDFIRRLAQGT